MTVTMYDSTTATDIPADAPAVAGYVDGAEQSYPELVTLHPGKAVVGITALGSFLPGTRVGDIETGDLTAASGASWAGAMLKVGRRPTLYYSASRAGEVRDALTAEGLNPSPVDFWPADWTGQPHLIPGSVATQYANPTTSGGHFDLSLATEAWLAPSIVPGPDPVPVPPDPTTGEVEDMCVVDDPQANQRHVFGVVNGVPFHWWQTLHAQQGQNYDWSHEQLPTS